jgi:mRNA-degrading endonuclease RelE of RelBE toxin-antitoxin system
MVEYRLLYSQTSRNQIVNLRPGIKPIMRTRLDLPVKEPFSGKRLERELSGCRSLRARGVRIIYKLKAADRIIEIHYVGHRRDVYELFAEKTGRFDRKPVQPMKPTYK